MSTVGEDGDGVDSLGVKALVVVVLELERECDLILSVPDVAGCFIAGLGEDEGGGVNG